MAKAKTAQTPKVDTNSNLELVNALKDAIELTRPTPKKNISNRKSDTPWTPKDGSAKLKLKRAMYQHGIPIHDDRISNEEISVLNKIRPGVYCDGHVKVVRRRDRGINIDYPIKTAAQRLKLINQYGIVDLTSLCNKLITEAAQPKKIENEEVED